MQKNGINTQIFLILSFLCNFFFEKILLNILSDFVIKNFKKIYDYVCNGIRHFENL